jgi:uracil phosphoribosyltransferase
MTANHVTVVDHPLVQHKLSLMRRSDTAVVQFRQLAREIALLLAYELTRDLPLTTAEITTPVAPMQAPVLAGKKLCLVSILRAATGFWTACSIWCRRRGLVTWGSIAIRNR